MAVMKLPNLLPTFVVTAVAVFLIVGLLFWVVSLR
jgi:hypothetical protein